MPSPSLPRLRHGTKHDHLSHLNLILIQSILSFVLLLALVLLSPLSLTFPTAPSPERRHRFMPTTRDLTLLSLCQTLCVVDPEATCLSSVEPRVSKSIIPLSAFRSSPLNFLRLLSTYHSSPQPAQTGSPTPR